LDVYRTEEQQIESLKEWWKENGASVVLGIALGLGAIFGWRYWQAHRLAEAEVAAALYEKVIGSLQQSDEKTAAGTALRIVEEFPGIGYAVFARLLLARLAVESGELEPAASWTSTILLVEALVRMRMFTDRVALHVTTAVYAPTFGFCTNWNSGTFTVPHRANVTVWLSDECEQNAGFVPLPVGFSTDTVNWLPHVPGSGASMM